MRGKVAPAGAREGVREAFVAVRNAFILGGSLFATWTVALLVRLVLPRHLGPAHFGAFNYAETLAQTGFVFLGLGLGTYIQKEIPVRMRHASDFFGGVLVLRVALSLGLFAAMASMVRLQGRPYEVMRAVFIFGVSQLLVRVSNDMASLLHAARRVGRLAIVNIVAKVTWGTGISLALLMHTGLEGLALATLASEALRVLLLFGIARSQLVLRLRVDARAVYAVIAASLPYYVSAVAFTLYAKIDITIMAFVSNDEEIGWYGSAQNFSAVAMLIAPLINWVVMPQLSRAAARSDAELTHMLRRCIEWALGLSIPVSLFMSLGADIWVGYVFGPAFMPAVMCLRILAPIFALTYLAILTSMHLILQGRAWTVTGVSLAALALNAILNVSLISWAGRALGRGGAGAGAAAISVFTEALTVCVFGFLIGSRAFDRRSVAAVAKSVLACGAIVALDHAGRSLGPARLVVDLAAYLLLVVLSGALRVTEMINLVHGAFFTRRSNAI